MSKTFWAIVAIIVVIFGGILIFKGDKANAPTGTNNKVQPTSHTLGAGTTGVTLQEYGDYECPFCSQFYPIVKQVTSDYGDKIKFQFSHLPLLQIHPNAFAAARAAEAAGKQGKFWEMHDMLYQNQNSWASASNPQPTFDSYAQQLGLNTAQFKKDAASSQVNDAINADINKFNTLGYEESTPTFILDGKKVTVGYDVNAFKKLIDAEIAKKAAH